MTNFLAKLFRRRDREAPRRRRLRLESLEPRVLLSSHPIISEFMALNGSTLADEDSQFSDWIEIQNTGDEPAALAGWHLTDDKDDLTQWDFPDVTLAPGEYLVVFASGKDRAVAGSELHTNFSLDGSGEYLALVEADGTTRASEFDPFPPQVQDISYGIGQDITVTPVLWLLAQ